jgi:hypothetical protein
MEWIDDTDCIWLDGDWQTTFSLLGLTSRSPSDYRQRESTSVDMGTLMAVMSHEPDCGDTRANPRARRSL